VLLYPQKLPYSYHLSICYCITCCTNTPGAVTNVRSAGQISVGAWLSFTVTVNVQVDGLFVPSVPVRVTVVTPLLKVSKLAIIAIGYGIA